jgi:hypothetical protein
MNFYIKAEHTLQPGRCLGTRGSVIKRGINPYSDDLISLTLTTAREWAALPATPANDFRRRAGRAVLLYAGADKV